MSLGLVISSLTLGLLNQQHSHWTSILCVCTHSYYCQHCLRSGMALNLMGPCPASPTRMRPPASRAAVGHYRPFVAAPQYTQHHPAQQLSRRERLVVARVGGMPGDNPFESLLRSKVFANSIVLQEFNTMVNELMTLSKMSSKFPDFDTAGKRMYLEKMRDGGERYELFIKRLELSDDPAAREFIRITNAQMLNGGFTLRDMFSGLKSSITFYEQCVVAEEAALAAGPEQHQAYLKEFRKVWQQTFIGAVSMDDLGKSLSPEVLMRAQEDPQFYRALKEISDNPTPEVISRWMSNERLAPLVTELARSMLQQQAKRQV